MAATHTTLNDPDSPLLQHQQPESMLAEGCFPELLTPESGSELSPASMMFHSPGKNCLTMQIGDPWQLCLQQTVQMQESGGMLGMSDISSQDEQYFDTGAALIGEVENPDEPKKARRQAQNRAAQRAFRERKEKYIQELEGKTLVMAKKITKLEADRKRLEAALQIARAEVNAFRSLPQHTIPQTTTSSEKSHIQCRLETPGSRHTVVLTLEIGVQAANLGQKYSQGASAIVELTEPRAGTSENGSVEHGLPCKAGGRIDTV